MTSNVGTQLLNNPDVRRLNITSTIASAGFGVLGAAAAFPLVAGAVSPLSGILAGGFGAELPISLLGASIELNLPPITIESMEQDNFFRQQQATCFLDRA